jgi:hypothetical protein
VMPPPCASAIARTNEAETRRASSPGPARTHRRAGSKRRSTLAPSSSTEHELALGLVYARPSPPERHGGSRCRADCRAPI